MDESAESKVLAESLFVHDNTVGAEPDTGSDDERPTVPSLKGKGRGKKRDTPFPVARTKTKGKHRAQTRKNDQSGDSDYLPPSNAPATGSTDRTVPAPLCSTTAVPPPAPLADTASPPAPLA